MGDQNDTAKCFTRGTAFTMNQMSVWVVNTTEGPVVRMWVPLKGWYHCIYAPGGVWQAKIPANPEVFIQLAAHVYTMENHLAL